MYLFLMSAVMAINACSTLVASFALVSINGIPTSSAKAYGNTSKFTKLLILPMLSAANSVNK